MKAEVFVIGSGLQHATYAAALVGFGCRVREVNTFDVARTMLRAGMIPTTILIDTNLRSKDMAGFIAYVRQEFGHKISIVVVGSNPQEEAAACNTGADVFLYRPVELSDLLHTVQHFA
ncbi:MAG: hypothetical protein SF029_19440 [bacterium]|nr:hypothetical protein [bacterium]